MQSLLKNGERVDDLIINGLKIIQHPNRFRFSLDAVMLAHFATVKKNDTVIDLGTGSGVIPLLLTTRENLAQVYGLEIQAEMVDMAHRSVELNNLQGKIAIRHGDLRKIKEVFPQPVANLVTANPPYMPSNTGAQNQFDSIKIARHEVLCCLFEVIKAAQQILVDKGRFCIIHRANRLAEVIGYCREFGLEPRRLRLVQPRLGQKPNLVMIEAVKGAKPDLEIMENLLVYQGQEYSPDIMAMYYGRE